VAKKSTKTNFGPMPWYQVWWLSVVKPTVYTYRELLERVVHPIRMAYLWIGVVCVIAGILRVVAYMAIHYDDPTMTSLPLSVLTLPI
jgi:hypothetical protein